MTQRALLLFCVLLLVISGLSSNTFADTSHARIVRLSLVEGDVRFAPSFRDDPLTDENAPWQAASLNLPLRQGYVLATNHGRAEVEFENGAMLFLGYNSVLEFYDLSSEDGARVTRLVLRQGTATVYVHPANGDYFSLTGGDFTVEATERARFRLDNFDDGSTVGVEQGHTNVLRDKKSTPLEKDQSLSIQASNSGDEVIGRTAAPDDFDHWVSGRIDSVVTATNYSLQYANSPSYSAGFGDLYNYGSWFSMAGYGYGWRPLGVGFGWSPFDYGSWYEDPFYGVTFIGSAPWGWLPYHYGAWIFSPVYGWVWVPTGFSTFGPLHYRPATAVWVRNGTSLGIVPLHPADRFGKTAQNLNQGIYPVENSQIARSSVLPGPGKWSVVKQAPAEMQAPRTFVASTAPSHVSRTIVTSAPTSNRVVTESHDSSISYDPVEKRYVNSGSPTTSQQAEARDTEARAAEGRGQVNRGSSKQLPDIPIAAQAASRLQEPAKPGIAQTPAAPRMSIPPRPPATPAPARTSGGGPTGGSSSHGSGSHGAPPSSWGGGLGSSHGSSAQAGTHNSPGTSSGHPH
jgi:hypothetical protein